MMIAECTAGLASQLVSCSEGTTGKRALATAAAVNATASERKNHVRTRCVARSRRSRATWHVSLVGTSPSLDCGHVRESTERFTIALGLPTNRKIIAARSCVELRMSWTKEILTASHTHVNDFVPAFGEMAD
jgi:hypothetical protein